MLLTHDQSCPKVLSSADSVPRSETNKQQCCNGVELLESWCFIAVLQLEDVCILPLCIAILHALLEYNDK